MFNGKNFFCELFETKPNKKKNTHTHTRINEKTMQRWMFIRTDSRESCSRDAVDSKQGSVELFGSHDF